MRKKARRPRRTLPLVARLNRIAATHRMTHAEIAKAIGVDVSCVTKWRSKNRQPRHGLIRAALVKFLEKHETKSARLVK